VEAWKPLAVVGLTIAGCSDQIAGSSGGDASVMNGAGSGVVQAANYYYCVVQPQIILGGLTQKPCGGTGNQSCHYSDTVPAMALIPTPPVTCTGSGTSAAPSDPSQVSANTAAAANFSTAWLEMSTPYTNAPFYLWPTGIVGSHVTVFEPTDTAVVEIIKTWATAQQ
jgi:hypothetical protein